jgi:hypothetical protein
MSNEYQQRPNSGTLSKNDKKTEDRHPEYRGSAVIGGKQFWISAWVKEGKLGKFFSLSFTEKTDGNAPRSQSNAKTSEDGLPF